MDIVYTMNLEILSSDKDLLLGKSQNSDLFLS